MQRVFELIYKYRAFFLFLFFESICSVLIIRYNSFQSAAYFSTSNQIAGSIFDIKSTIISYFDLTSENEDLANENARLRRLIFDLEDIHSEEYMRQKAPEDTSMIFIPAKVVNNSLFSESNYLTLNKGTSDGIQVGMGVISPNGVVGRVYSCSENYSSVMSILHPNNKISAKIKHSNVNGRVVWDGVSYQNTRFLEVPRHHELKKGDEVVTSGYNAIFPEGVSIGEITEIELEDYSSFYNSKVKLSNDMSQIHYVYVVQKCDIEEQSKLEKSKDEQ